MKYSKYNMRIVIVIIIIILAALYFLRKRTVEKFNSMNKFAHLITYHHPGEKQRLGANGDGGYVIAEFKNDDSYISVSYTHLTLPTKRIV